jgi:hypothetical protein
MPMRVELALFDGDTLLDRSEVVVTPVESESTSTFKLFHARHRLGTESAFMVLEEFADHLNIKRSSLDMPIQESRIGSQSKSGAIHWHSSVALMPDYALKGRAR